MLTLRDMDILIQTAGVLFDRRREMKDALAAAAKRITDWDESEEGQRMAASVVKTAAPFVGGLPFATGPHTYEFHCRVCGFDSGQRAAPPHGSAWTPPVVPLGPIARPQGTQADATRRAVAAADEESDVSMGHIPCACMRHLAPGESWKDMPLGRIPSAWPRNFSCLADCPVCHGIGSILPRSEPEYDFQTAANSYLDGSTGKPLISLLREVYQEGFSAGMKKTVEMIDETKEGTPGDIRLGKPALIGRLREQLWGNGPVETVTSVIREAVKAELIALLRLRERSPQQEEEKQLLSILDWTLYHWAKGSFKTKEVREIVANSQTY